jgi:hypothetical protein
VADLNGDGKPDLVLGSRSGGLRVYSAFTDHLITFPAPQANWLVAEAGTVLSPSQLGGSLVPAVADLNGDGRPELVLGTHGGGLILWRNVAK